MKLHLIRHGQTEGNRRKLYYGKTDLPLTAEGLAQLEANRQRGGYPSLEGLQIYTTSLQRTVQTLNALYGDVNGTPLPDFCEVNFGIFEMRSYEELKHDPQYQTFIQGDYLSNIAPQGESYRQFATRVLSQLQALVELNQSALVVAHGGTISVIMNHLFPDQNKTIYDWMPPSGEGFTITLGDSPIYDHLPQPSWIGKHYAFFQNAQCEYFPCHKTSHPEDFNCLFCYCPLFALGEHCGGNFTYTDSGNKNCTNCSFPHQRQNYGIVLEKYPLLKALTQKKEVTQESP